MHVMFCDWWIYLKIIALPDTMWEEMKGIMLLATGLYQIYLFQDEAEMQFLNTLCWLKQKKIF